MDAESVAKPPAKRSARLGWLDGNRAFAAVGVILIHSTTDMDGQLFPRSAPAERVVPSILRAIGETASSELFILFSMFLLAWRLVRRPISYGGVLADQARRLLVPFVAWTLYYAFFRLAKATAFSYQAAILDQLSTAKSWLGYLVLGNSQYHMHFIPTLFCVLLAYPLFKSAQRYPILGGLGLLFGLYTLNSSQGWLWGGGISDPVLREYLVRLLKIFCYTGYGMAAFGFYGLWERKLSEEDARLLFRGALMLCLLALVGNGTYVADLVLKGRWVVRPGAAYYAHFLLPVFVFACFMGTAYAGWSPQLSKFSKLTFGVYFVHPMFIDIFDIGLRRGEIALDPWLMVIAKFLVVVPASFGLAYLLSKHRFTAWLVGLQEKAAPAPKLTSPGERLSAPAE